MRMSYGLDIARSFLHPSSSAPSHRHADSATTAAASQRTRRRGCGGRKTSWANAHGGRRCVLPLRLLLLHEQPVLLQVRFYVLPCRRLILCVAAHELPDGLRR